ncbi:hypothetical protein niasHS_000752 [Heterodera schachtii]|uniref:Uncharacterized protein n=1 Tax=Heterodera schachtii TaxID=97005 RepID=A0ABD2KMB9_HETSC
MATPVIQLFLSSPKPTPHFAAVRTLNRIFMDYPQAVISCNVGLEQLITGSNAHIGHHHVVEKGCRGERGTTDETDWHLRQRDQRRIPG